MPPRDAGAATHSGSAGPDEPGQQHARGVAPHLSVHGRPLLVGADDDRAAERALEDDVDDQHRQHRDHHGREQRAEVDRVARLRRRTPPCPGTARSCRVRCSAPPAAGTGSTGPRKLKIATEAMPGRAIGSMTGKKVRHSPAPSIAAASATSSGSARKNGEQEEHGERQRERHVGDDQARQRVEQADALQDEEQRHDREEDREGQPRQHQVVDRPGCRRSGTAPARRRTWRRAPSRCTSAPPTTITVLTK